MLTATLGCKAILEHRRGERTVRPRGIKALRAVLSLNHTGDQ